MRPDFSACGQEFLNHSNDLYSHFLYNGTLRGPLNAIHSPMMTIEGCKKLCGSGTAYYEWQALPQTVLRQGFN